MSQVETASKLRETWGASHFVTFEPKLLAALGVYEETCAVLEQVGLPIGPESGLELSLRFETVQIRHSPKDVRLLSASEFQRPACYPLTGEPHVDVWARLDRFIVLGECPNDNAPNSRYFETRFLCLDASTGRIAWVHPKPMKDGTTLCFSINSGLVAYLASLLAYKQFRDRWPEIDALSETDSEFSDEGDISQSPRLVLADRIHAEFLQELEAADPSGFKDFWECHAWNEHILLHS